MKPTATRRAAWKLVWATLRRCGSCCAGQRRQGPLVAGDCARPARDKPAPLMVARPGLEVRWRGDQKAVCPSASRSGSRRQSWSAAYTMDEENAKLQNEEHAKLHTPFSQKDKTSCSPSPKT